MILAAGRLGSFAAACSNLHVEGDGSATISRRAAALLGIAPGDSFTAIGR
jgi:hypothetical protein